jgi:hypothetical protein
MSDHCTPTVTNLDVFVDEAEYRKPGRELDIPKHSFQAYNQNQVCIHNFLPVCIVCRVGMQQVGSRRGSSQGHGAGRGGVAQCIQAGKGAGGAGAWARGCAGEGAGRWCGVMQWKIHGKTISVWSSCSAVSDSVGIREMVVSLFLAVWLGMTGWLPACYCFKAGVGLAVSC